MAEMLEEDSSESDKDYAKVMVADVFKQEEEEDVVSRALRKAREDVDIYADADEESPEGEFYELEDDEPWRKLEKDTPSSE